MAETTHPWLVVDTWGTDAPTGCWTAEGARALAERLSLSWRPGRYEVERNALQARVV